MLCNSAFLDRYVEYRWRVQKPQFKASIIDRQKNEVVASVAKSGSDRDGQSPRRFRRTAVPA